MNPFRSLGKRSPRPAHRSISLQRGRFLRNPFSNRERRSAAEIPEIPVHLLPGHFHQIPRILQSPRFKELRIRNGFSRNAAYDIVYDGENSIDAVKNHDELLPGTDIFTEDQLAVAGFLSAGLDFALNRKLDCSVTKDGTIPERCVYVDVRGEKLRHEARSGATLRTTGTHYVLGLKGKLNDREDVEKDVNGAIYLEAGRSNLRVRTQWAKGDGDGEYYGLGLIAEYRRHEGDFKGSYLQLHGRIGKASSNFDFLLALKDEDS